jgi:TolA-binding protein
MNDKNNEIGPEENELLKEFGTSLEALRQHHADCPKPEVLLASQAGVLDGETAGKVANHLKRCNFCQILLRDLTDAELIAARPDEEERVRERVLAGASEATRTEKASEGRQRIWFWRLAPLATIAAAAFAIVAWVHFHQPGTTGGPQVAVGGQPNKITASSALQWEKLPIKLEASSILVWRGQPRTAQEKYAAELASALGYYRDDNYAEAAERLGQVVEGFPRGIEGQLYLGISQLKLQKASDAIPHLLMAQQLSSEQFRDDATWFLALAYEGSQDTQHALTELQKLCGGESSYAARACSGIQELSAQPPKSLQR